MKFRETGAVGDYSARSIVVSGRVQGVGFRPFVFRTAYRFRLGGWVRNGSGQVHIYVEGRGADLMGFETALCADAPFLARPQLECSRKVKPEGILGFGILASESSQETNIHLPPDIFCCPTCMVEIETSAERRYGYPFTNCTQCGPRYTIIRALPYDRPNTTMAGFPLCWRCAAEYGSPLDRRFHAQPMACPECGPVLSFVRDENCLIGNAPAMKAAITCLQEGKIVAVKGIGGYHLMCDAANNEAVLELRRRKHRPGKPLAVMFPQTGADGLGALRNCVALNLAQAAACLDPVRPITLMRRLETCNLAKALSPGLSDLGVFLPYSPFHHLLLMDFGGPLVATSGNIDGEPVIIDNNDAEQRLASIADAFLHHDRPIERPADDSVVQVISGLRRPMRIGRGMAPMEIDLPSRLREPVVAVGGHMKSAIALGWNNRIVVSPHIGDLDSSRALGAFERAISDLQALYRVDAARLLCDVNRNYASARWTGASGLPVTHIQHHMAHASALAGENPEIGRWLTFVWDGAGLGTDGSLWGGEAFVGSPGAWRRVASFRPFHLLGGDRAAREPWRAAAALMWQSGRDYQPPDDKTGLAVQAWRKRVGCFETSSVGRLFDAAAALILGIGAVSYEGEGPMLLESMVQGKSITTALPLEVVEGGVLRANWESLLSMLTDTSVPKATRAGIFHEVMAQTLLAQVKAVVRIEKFEVVGLSGGVFQNKVLCERVASLVEANGISVLQHRTVPANDGGLAFGQVIEYLHSSGLILARENPK